MRLLLTLAVGLAGTTACFANKDSIGVKTVNNQLYIMHKVEKSQGLFAIGRLYNVSAKQIEQANPQVKSGLELGQVILIPTNRKTTATQAAPKQGNAVAQAPRKETPAPKAAAPGKKDPIYHKVVKGETLYRIAVNHNMTVDELKKLNKIPAAGIAEGQNLVVGYRNSGAAAPADEPEERVTPAATPSRPQKNWEDETEEPTKPEAKTQANTDGSDTKYATTRYGDKIDASMYNDAQKEKKTIDSEKDKGRTVSKEVNESGVASYIDDGSVVARKNMALHRSAPYGTLIKITNPMNKKTVFVTVVGKLPQNMTEENCMIKITKTAADKLGVIDKFFRVDMQYVRETVK